LGLLPCPAYHQVTKGLFKEASLKMMALSQQYASCNFIKMHQPFLFAGEIKRSLFVKDGIDLSKEGNTIYANKIVRYILALPK
jgi:hypothetical protein